MEEQKYGRKDTNNSPMLKSKTFSAPSSPFICNLSVSTSAVSPAEGPKRQEDVRIIQRTLVYIINLPSSASDESILSSKFYFGKYGKIVKIHINPGHHNNCDPTYAAYLTYSNEEEAAVCVRACNEFVLDGKKLIVNFGTTKYCSYFLKNTRCPKSECVFLHAEASKADTMYREDLNSTRHIRPMDSIMDRLKVHVSQPVHPSRLPEVSFYRDRATSEIIEAKSTPPLRSRILSTNAVASRYHFTLDGDEDCIEVPQCIEKLREYASPCKDSAVVPKKDIEEILSPLSPFKWASDIMEVTPSLDTQASVVVSIKRYRTSL